MSDMDKYVKQLVDDGFIAEDGTPIKCSCGCTDFERVKEYYDTHSLVEYQLQCARCNKIVGHWAYGYWQV